MKSQEKMLDVKKEYKKPPSTFGNTKQIKIKLIHEQREQRKARRTKDFEKNRKEKKPSRSTASQNDEIKKKLLQWKTEREKKKKTEKSQKKPPFIVGVVRHDVYFPVATTDVSATTKNKRTKQTEQMHIKKESAIKKRITKATEKRLQAKANVEKREMPSTSTAKKSSTNYKIESDINKRESFAPPNHEFHPPAGLPRIFLFGEVFIDNSSSKENNNLTCDKSTENITTSVKDFTHFNSDSIETITLKVSSDEETLDRSPKKQTANSMEQSTLNNINVKTISLSTSLLNVSYTFTATEKEICIENLTSSPKYLSTAEDIGRKKLFDSDLETSSRDKSPIKTEAISKSPDVEEKKHPAEYFKHLLCKERDRLQKLCDEWTEIQSQSDITEDVWYQINQAVGQTSMLIKEKFKQFHNLVLDWEKGNGGILVTYTDLHGFWDMMYIEVTDCESRFAKLEKLCAGHWREEPLLTESREKAIAKKQVEPAKRRSRLTSVNKKKEKVAEIRNNKKENSRPITNGNNECIMFSMSDSAANILKNNVTSNRSLGMYTSTPIHNNVRSNISNQLNTSLITMKVSQYNKCTMQVNDTTLCLTHEQTPRKDIMKKSPGKSRTDLRIKLACKADLNDHLILTKPSNKEEQKIDPNVQVLPKNINSLESGESTLYKLNICNDKRSDSDNSVSSLCQTVIETVWNKSDTLTSPHNIDLIESPIEKIF